MLRPSRKLLYQQLVFEIYSTTKWNHANTCRNPSRRQCGKFCRARGYSTDSHKNSNNQNHNPNSTDLSSTPRPSDSLPKSPLFQLAEKHQTGRRPRKPQRSKEDDARLENNPWAMALASPLRVCAGTARRIPKAFLTDLSLVRQIDDSSGERTGQERKHSLWWVPTGVLKEKLPTLFSELSSSGQQRPPVRRLLTRALLMKYMPEAVRSSSGKKIQAASIVPSEWKIRMRRSELVEVTQLNWPPGLSNMVLGHLGKQVVDTLQEAYRIERLKRGGQLFDQWRTLQVSENLDVPSLIEGLRRIVDMPDMGTGGLIVMGDDPAFDAVQNDVYTSGSLPDYLTLPQTQSSVPVFDLRSLLSPSHRQKLRESIPRFGEKALFFRADGLKSVKAMLALWELKGYVMHDTDFASEMRARTA